MKYIIFILMAFTLLSCSKDNDYSTLEEKVEIRAKKEKVTICHQTGNGQITIEVSENAVQAHLDHGDYLGECFIVSCPPFC